MLIIALDDGHGMATPGKRSPERLGPVLHENEFNRAVTAYLAEALAREGVRTMLTAPGDGDTPLAVRVARARAAGAKLLISIHANAGGGTGIETFYQQDSTTGARLARLVQAALIDATAMEDRGCKTDHLFMTRVPARHGITAVLTELGFMDTPADLARLRHDAYRRRCADAITRAVKRYVFGA